MMAENTVLVIAISVGRKMLESIQGKNQMLRLQHGSCSLLLHKEIKKERFWRLEAEKMLYV